MCPPSNEELQSFLAKHGVHEATFDSVLEDIEDRQKPAYIRKANRISMAQWKHILAFCQLHRYPGADRYPVPNV